MKHRNLRFAWSLAWGIPCLLLAALWGRSYWWADYVQIADTKTQVVSICGDIGFQRSEFVDTEHWGWEPESVADLQSVGRRIDGVLLFVWVTSEVVVLPVWLLMLFPAALATAPWLRWFKRFSLRTLLIVMTLIAMLLGLVKWFGR